MRINAIIILISLVTATVFISGGYGYWQKEIKIEGDITVVKPDLIISVEENPNSTDNESEERLPDASAEQEGSEQSLESEETVETELSEQIVSENDDKKSSKSVEGTQSESEETKSLPQDNVGDQQ